VYDVQVTSSVVQSDGRVTGLMARQYGKPLAIRAAARRCARVGQLRLQRCDGRAVRPGLVGRPAASIEQHDGQSIRMGQALGADLATWTPPRWLSDRPQQTVRGILVNGEDSVMSRDMYSGRIGS